ncbi:MAG TPA: NADH-quinone oxidoreductase subunit H [Spirochaetota bacterium]|mgnify:FL=1|nr:NADH-quinone oxidoreductase subunit H [Spirochaetota bacterium]
MTTLIFTLLMPVIVLVAGIVLGLVLKGVDRKFAAYYQSRIGPPVLQPFYDMGKLMMKQTIIPENAVKWIFKGAPVTALSGAVLLLIYIVVPYFLHLSGFSHFFLQAGDLIVILYVLAIPTIALVSGGFSSGSPYAAIGAQREVVILMSVELPLAVATITFATKMSAVCGNCPSFSLTTIASHPIWSTMGPMGILGGMMLLLSFVFIVPAESAKIPFDQGEAETEIAEGLLAEYSGKYLAFIQMADGVKSLALVSLTVILFFPHGFTDLTGLRILAGGYDFTLIADMLLFLMKVFAVYFVLITTVRIIMARFKISQAAKILLLTITVVSLSGYMLIYLDTIMSAL